MYLIDNAAVTGHKLKRAAVTDFCKLQTLIAGNGLSPFVRSAGVVLKQESEIVVVCHCIFLLPRIEF